MEKNGGEWAGGRTVFIPLFLLKTYGHHTQTFSYRFANKERAGNVIKQFSCSVLSYHWLTCTKELVDTSLFLSSSISYRADNVLSSFSKSMSSLPNSSSSSHSSSSTPDLLHFKKRGVGGRYVLSLRTYTLAGSLKCTEVRRLWACSNVTCAVFTSESVFGIPCFNVERTDEITFPTYLETFVEISWHSRVLHSVFEVSSSFQYDFEAAHPQSLTTRLSSVVCCWNYYLKLILINTLTLLREQATNIQNQTSIYMSKRIRILE